MPADLPQTIWTIGHSVRTLEYFLDLLKENDIKTLADVRSMPYSRRKPHFNKERLQASLAEIGINYVHIPELGGKRTYSEAVKDLKIRNKILRGFISILDSDEFKEGFALLKDEALVKKTAYMCAEADPTKCHRSIISDVLKSKGVKVIHIIDKDRTAEHDYTKGAFIRDNELDFK